MMRIRHYFYLISMQSNEGDHTPEVVEMTFALLVKGFTIHHISTGNQSISLDEPQSMSVGFPCNQGHCDVIEN